MQILHQILILLAASPALASVCSNTTNPFAGQTFNAPFKAVTSAQISKSGSVIQPPRLSGSVGVPPNGCQFSVKAFSFTPVAGSVYTFYGVSNVNATLGMRLTLANIKAEVNADINFDLIHDFSVSPPQSYADFNAFEIFDVTNDIVWATALLPAQNSVKSAVVSVSNSSSTASNATLPGSPPSANAKSDGNRIVLSALVLSILALLI